MMRVTLAAIALLVPAALSALAAAVAFGGPAHMGLTLDSAAVQAVARACAQ